MEIDSNYSLIFVVFLSFLILREGYALKCLETPDNKLKHGVWDETAKDEPIEVDCKNDEDTCFNVETTLDFKYKGCGKLKKLALEAIGPLTSGPGGRTVDNGEIMQDECKKFPSLLNNLISINQDLMKAQATYVNWANPELAKVEPDRAQFMKKMEDFKGYTICTCSADLCNGGFRIEGKSFGVVIVGFIILQFFMG